MSTQHTPVINPRTLVDTTYTVVIDERQRRLIHLALVTLTESLEDFFNEQMEEGDDAILRSLEDMLDPEGSTGPLGPSPAVNSFVL